MREVSDFMHDLPPTKDATPDGAVPSSSGSDTPIPERVGRYQVERILGQGGFGLVYLARDEQLKRSVAIKVPHAHLLSLPEDAEAYLKEARAVANLNHANIVPVYDVGSSDRFPCFIVSRYIEGVDLAKRLEKSPMSIGATVETVASVAVALHYAHIHGLVHRDIKPANLLLDEAERPFVADFGLALREHEYGQGPQYVGTAAYMSPEQARGEGHRVNGRSDIFSLGVVLYEMLTGRRPFLGDPISELLARIAMDDVRPPRQINDRIPKELERICLKALAKRASERYTTAKDMADDLRYWSRRASEEPSPADVRAGVAEPDKATRRLPVSDTDNKEAGTPTTRSNHVTPVAKTSSDRQILKVVPKGLRSFDANDADFFLELLAGPRDRYGMPESLRFWKSRIEAIPADETFSVGLIYGPSGCGKSSLVKAGLLPRLDPSVVRVYVEASGGDTEEGLLRKLRRQCPGLDDQLGLVDALSALRRGQCLARGEKVLLVIDQFEQWLHSHGGEKDAELVQALRQCDGTRVQCLVMVRDDFWLAVSRFMQALEIRVIEGENSRLVDLFDERHARKVLAALGHAFGAIPEAVRGKEQDAFLDQAVAALSQDGKVVPVRLSLFAEMVKSKPWTPAALREIGGAEGVGAAFLEETFSSPTAPPHHRLHQKSAQSVLAALLPEAGSDIKGHMRSREELLEASGCRDQPSQFDEVIALLDGELRLVTPSDSESLDADGDAATPSTTRGKNYQLTHDYLVPSLRSWLTRKQKTTRRGRAELRLADLASLWTAKPENRRLPSIFEFLQIRFDTRRSTWSEAQRKMMAAAARFHVLRGLATMVVIALIAMGAYQYHGRFKAFELRDQLFTAEIDKLPVIIDDMTPYRKWVNPLLWQNTASATKNGDEAWRLRASLALLPGDESQVDYLYDRLINAAPAEFDIIRQALLPHKERLSEKLWRVVSSPRDDQQHLCAASSLALYAPNDPRWNAAAPDIAAILARSGLFLVKFWTGALEGVQDKLVGPLTSIARDPARGPNERFAATNIVAACAPDRPELLTPILIDGDDEQFAVVFPLMARLGPVSLRLLEGDLELAISNDPTDPKNERIAQGKARAAVALLRLGQPEKVWPLFKQARDERVRSYLIEWCRSLKVDPQRVIQHWAEETDLGARSALLLLLGEFPAAVWPESQRQDLVQRLLAIFEKEPDAGLHAAAQWLLRKLNCEDRVQAAIERLETNEAQWRAAPAGDRRQWYVNRQGQTFVIIDARQPFTMGSPKEEPGRDDNETQHQRNIGRRYAIAASPVTKAQFRRFQTDRPHVAKMPVEKFVRTDDSPQTGMTWYEAAEYCNWLSEKEGIPPDQWHYEPNPQGKYAAGMRAKDQDLALNGYRLPTEAEWEFACRAGTITRFSFGQDDSLLAGYGWYKVNSQRHTSPTTGLKPNDFGLFDMQGNVWQWCETPNREYPAPGSAIDDPSLETTNVASDVRRVLRGGAYNNLPDHLRAAYRAFMNPDTRQPDFGFRPARTINF